MGGAKQEASEPAASLSPSRSYLLFPKSCFTSEEDGCSLAPTGMAEGHSLERENNTTIANAKAKRADRWQKSQTYCNKAFAEITAAKA